MFLHSPRAAVFRGVLFKFDFHVDFPRGVFPFDMSCERRFLSERRRAVWTVESHAGVNLPMPTQIVLGSVLFAAVFAFVPFAFVFAVHVHF